MIKKGKKETEKKMKIFLVILLILFIKQTTQQQQLQAPALLLTTYDSISIVYPKEMGYEKDFLQIIYKITEQNESIVLRIEDAVYDQNQASIYFILSIHKINVKTLKIENYGCELIRLKQFHHHQTVSSSSSNSNHIIATNWSQNLIYKNQTISILSMQMNEKKMKIYWLEYNYISNKWSIVVMKLSHSISNSHNFDYYTFSRPNIKFSTDGYSYISVIHDTIDEQPLLTKPHAKKLSKKAPKQEILLFITNNQTLNICFLSNLTCRNFFNSNHKEVSDYDDFYEDEEEEGEDEMLTTTSIQPTVTFNRLMGIQYDQKEHTLYIADYGYDRIEKIVFETNTDEHMNTDNIDIKASYIQTLVQSSPGQLPINPIMSVAYDNNIFWTDFEDGLKSTIYKSPCIRSVYRVKNATTLKLIHIIAKASINHNRTLEGGQNGYRLSSIQKNQFLFPPDYYSSLSDHNEFEALVSSSQILKSFNFFVFFLFSIIFSIFFK